MSVDRQPDWYTVVRRHWRGTIGYLLASRAPCISIRNQEVKSVKGRVLVGRGLEDLAEWIPPASWVLGVILCPGDTVEGVVTWLRATRADSTRVWFYLHVDTHHRVLPPWEKAGFPADQVDFVSDWRELHKLFGLALNDRVYQDWAIR